MSEGGEARNHEAEAVARALMKRWIDQANAERYIGGPHTSPMVEPEEYDIDDPPEGMWEQALGDAIAALDAVRCAQGRDTDAPERSPQTEVEAILRSVYTDEEGTVSSRQHVNDAIRECLQILAERSPQGEDQPTVPIEPNPDAIRHGTRQIGGPLRW